MSRFFAYDPNQAYLLAAEREGRAGGRALVLPIAGHGGAVRSEPVRAGLQCRRTNGLSAEHDAEGVALCVLFGSELDAAAGAEDAGRPGLPLSGWGIAAGPQNAERIFTASPACDQRCVYAGGADGAAGREGEAGTRSHRFDAGGSQRVAVESGGPRAGAAAVGPGPAPGAGVSAEGERTGSGRRRRSEPEPGATTGAGGANSARASSQGTTAGLVN